MILVDGRPGPDTVSLYDGAVLRGDGCFETIRSYGGTAFRLDAHLDRLEHSAAMLTLEVPDRESLAGWVRRVATAGGDCLVRIVLTRGSVIPGSGSGPRCLVLSHEFVGPPIDMSLMVVQAPWHSAGQSWELEGAKTLSYAPNLAAGRHAQKCGFSDAVLVSRDGWLLEGPTFSIAWVAAETLETPSLDLSILDSITRRVVLDVAADLRIPVKEGRFGADRLAMASEVMALSTTKEVATVRRVDAHVYPAGPVTDLLATTFAGEVAATIRGMVEPTSP